MLYILGNSCGFDLKKVTSLQEHINIKSASCDQSGNKQKQLNHVYFINFKTLFW